VMRLQCATRATPRRWTASGDQLPAVLVWVLRLVSCAMHASLACVCVLCRFSWTVRGLRPRSYIYLRLILHAHGLGELLQERTKVLTLSAPHRSLSLPSTRASTCVWGRATSRLGRNQRVRK
jgi:hypothetical protein